MGMLHQYDHEKELVDLRKPTVQALKSGQEWRNRSRRPLDLLTTAGDAPRPELEGLKESLL